MYEKGTGLAEAPAHIKYADEVVNQINQFSLGEQNEFIWNVKNRIQEIRNKTIERLKAEIDEISNSLVDY